MNLAKNKYILLTPTPQNYPAYGCEISKDMNTFQKPGQKRGREISAACEVYQKHTWSGY